MTTNNHNKIILDLCGGSGAWSKPYAEAGYDVRVLTLPKYDVCNMYITRGVGMNRYFLFQTNIETAICDISDVYGILAAPPCTEFSLAKTTAPRDLEKGFETVRACLEIIWQCQIHGKLAFWALENPRGLLTRFLGKPAFKFEQWQFGGTIEKPTYIWGVFNEPKPTVAEKPAIDRYFAKDGRYCNNNVDYANPKCPEEYAKYINSMGDYESRRAAIRAITPAGFAQAFYKANK